MYIVHKFDKITVISISKNRQNNSSISWAYRLTKRYGYDIIKESEGLTMNDKKILVIFTGGTIGSAINGETIDVDSNCKFRLVADYKLFYGEKDFECVQLYNILSENTGFLHWETLIDYLLKVDTENYSGIIITHGSDTLSYTSALLGMYFRHIEIPVFVIASNK